MEWLVVFVDQTGPWTWWRPFTRPGFRHVVALRYDTGTRSWIMLDWARNGMKIEAVPTEVASWVLDQGWRGGGVLRIHQDIGRPRHGPRIAIFYCVTAVSHLLGISSWAVTPKQLHRALLRRGAEPFHPHGESR